MSRVLIVDDDRALCRSLQIQLEEENHEVRVSHSGNDGLAALSGWQPDLLLLDLRLPDRDGLSVLKEVTDVSPGLPVVIITGEMEMKAAVEAMRAGAFDYLRKPFDFDEVLLVLEKSNRRRTGITPFGALTAHPAVDQDNRELVGVSRSILEIVKQVGLLSRSRVTVLIEGESGTGKELVARALHEASCPECNFVALNCSALAPSLLESELFGHEKGAFTGAHALKTGKLEYAGEGTVFLDEIGDMPLELQARLLRVLQEREFERVGGLASIPFLARVTAATHHELEALVREGKFREDLFYRLAVTRLNLPPLRERPEDIPVLSSYLVERIAQRLHSAVRGLDRSALELLRSYDWPGNVRELENVLTRAVALCRGGTLGLEDIGHALGRPPVYDHGANRVIKPLHEAEKDHILHALDSGGWNITRTAAMLEISPTTLRKKIRDYGLVC